MKHRRSLYVLLSAGLLALAAGGGTFASFTAETDNPGNTFATGSLLMSNLPSAGTVCFSVNGVDNANPGCSTLVNVTGEEPGQGGTIVTASVTLGDTGTIDAGTFTLLPPASNDCTSSQVTNLTFNSGNLCDDTVMFVEETAQGTVNATTGVLSASTHYTYCWYGYSTDSGTTCDQIPGDLDTNNTNTIANFDSSQSSGITLLPLTASGTTGSGTELAAGQGRQFTIGLYLPNSVGNTDQALKAIFGLDWTLAQ